MVQQEEGNIYYKQIVSGPSGGIFKFAEAWSSQRTLYKHLLQSPTVQRVFRGDLLKALAYPNITVEPNWGVSAPQIQSSAPCTHILSITELSSPTMPPHAAGTAHAASRKSILASTDTESLPMTSSVLHKLRVL